MKTIFDVYVPMQDQAQCDRMKQVCIDAGLPYGFDRIGNEEKIFYYNPIAGCFDVWLLEPMLPQVTESEFLTLLNEYKSKTNGK